MGNNYDIGIYEGLMDGDLEGLQEVSDNLWNAGFHDDFLMNVISIASDNPDWGNLLWALSNEMIWITISPVPTYSTNTHIAWRWEARIGRGPNGEVLPVWDMESSRKEGELLCYQWCDAARDAVRYVCGYYDKFCQVN